ncbi:MAG: hypothetical protein U7123_27585 [Potamolinea sp.]
MNYPNICFVDDNGELPWQDGIQHIRQFGGRWRVRLEEEWQWGVAIDENSPLPLKVWNKNDWVLPRNTAQQQQDLKRLAGSAGQITAVLLDSFGKPIKNGTKATLAIAPANITDEQLDQIIREIGLLALSTSSHVAKEMSVSFGEESGNETKGLQWVAGHGSLVTTTALLGLASVVKENWATIEKRPLKSIVTQVAPVNVGRVNSSPQLLIKAKVQPANRRVLGITRVESTKCSENEFLCYILDVYLGDVARGLAENLEGILNTYEQADNNIYRPQNLSGSSKDFPDFIKMVDHRISEFNNKKEEQREYLKEKVQELKSYIEWAKQVRKSEFLKEVDTPSKPPLPSQRLISSPSYGLIFEKYSNSQGGLLSKIQNVMYLLECTFHSKVRCTWEIYEIWCFVRLYSAFVLYANMKPPRHERLMFECIEIKNGMLKIPDREFKLEGFLKGGKKISVSFWYDTLFQDKRPDIRITISVENESPKQYCFDAKYHNYKQQGYEWFVSNVLGVARDKYLNFLDSDASFILHTDDIDYWGEVPFRQILLDKVKYSSDRSSVIGKVERNDKYFILKSDLEKKNINGEVGHKYGAISLKPNQKTEIQLKKLIRLLLQYHGSLNTACIPCGYQLQQADFRESYSINKKGVGTYCSCPRCGYFWVVSHCSNSAHPLLKFKDSFHKRSEREEHKEKWIYICPECSDDPEFSQFNRRG